MLPTSTAYELIKHFFLNSITYFNEALLIRVAKYINKDGNLIREMTKKRWMNLIVNNMRIVHV